MNVYDKQENPYGYDPDTSSLRIVVPAGYDSLQDDNAPETMTYRSPDVLHQLALVVQALNELNTEA